MKRYEHVVFMELEGNPEEKALAYKNPQKASAEMNSHLWAVPTIPTPFVGEAPAPGHYGHNIINSQQFRHPVNVVLPKPQGTYRIFFTGGSTAFCSGAPNDDATISAYLQKRLNQRLTPVTGLTYEVINAACPGWASTHERLWIEFKLAEMEPDLIIHFSGNNEAYWGARNYSVGCAVMENSLVGKWFLLGMRFFGKKPMQDNAPRTPAKGCSRQRCPNVN